MVSFPTSHKVLALRYITLQNKSSITSVIKSSRYNKGEPIATLDKSREALQNSSGEQSKLCMFRYRNAATRAGTGARDMQNASAVHGLESGTLRGCLHTLQGYRQWGATQWVRSRRAPAGLRAEALSPAAAAAARTTCGPRPAASPGAGLPHRPAPHPAAR